MNPRKQIDIQEVQYDERRDAYRRPQTQAHRLSLSVKTPSGEDFIGMFHDLSISGASAKFDVSANKLIVGHVVILLIGSMTRTAKVIANARVMFNSETQGGRHCGFQFTEPKALNKQLDSFYGRFFNRRKAPRVGMPLDKRVAVQLFVTGTEVKAELVDLSAEGMQVRMKRAQAKTFDGANHLFLRMTLPGQQAEISGRAAILRRSQTNDTVTFGLAFDLLQERGISKHVAALHSWIVHRSHEISMWDGALTKPDVPRTPPGSNAAPGSTTDRRAG